MDSESLIGEDVDMDESGYCSDSFDLCDYSPDGSCDENGKYRGFDFDDGEGEVDYNEEENEECHSNEQIEKASINSVDSTKRSQIGISQPPSSITALLTPLTPMPTSIPMSIHDSESDETESIPRDEFNDELNDGISNEIYLNSSNATPLKYTAEIKEEAEKTSDDEINFKYQYDLRVYVNRCMFIRNTKIGKRVGFAPSLPKTKDFVLCWNCNDWIPPNVSPPCIPLCSQTHMHSKYVFDKMFGYFCSWGCCKKYIYETMSNANKSKYMRSLLQMRRIFYPELTNKPIETVEPRTCTTPYGGPKNPEEYYSSIVKINLPPLAEDISLTFNALKVA